MEEIMNNPILGIAIIVVCITVVVVKYVLTKKGVDISPQLAYLDEILEVLSNLINKNLDVLKLHPTHFESEEAFYKKLIEMVIDDIKELCEELKINIELINLIPQDILEDYIYHLIEKIIANSSVNTLMLDMDNTINQEAIAVTTIETQDISGQL